MDILNNNCDRKQIMELVFITDNTFSLPTGVAIRSLYEHRNKQINYNVNIICNNVESYNIDYFLQLNTEDFNINIIDVSTIKLHKEYMKKDFPVTISATFKFLLPNLFPDLNKILYIDGDVIIQSDLLELYMTDISNVYAGVIKDYHALTFKGDVWKRLGIKLDAYFNSGVMLLNLEKMRNDNITEKLIEYRLHGINYYMDQDALNVVFGKAVKYLSFTYNLTLTNWRNKSIEELSSYYNLEKVSDKYDYLRHAEIVHYASSDKPWNYYDTHYADVWFYYYLKSPFNKICLKRTTLTSQIDSPNIRNIRIQDINVNSKNYIRGVYPKLKKVPSISIILPVYNGEKYIDDCLTSIIDQTFSDFEVICIDDGSTDKSGEILDNWADKENRIKVIHQKNGFAGRARNQAIKIARGNYIVFIDSDDILVQDALEKFYNAAVSYNADVVISSVCIFDKTIERAQKSNKWLDPDYIPSKDCFSAKDIYPFIFNFTAGGPGGKCFKREYIIENNLKFLSLQKSEDFYFIHLGIAEANSIAVIREPIYFIRMVTTSLEHSKDYMPLLFWDAIMQMKETLIAKGIFEKVKQSFINENINRFVYNLKTMKTSEGYNMVLNKLQEIYRKELGLGEYPRNYYYRKDNYEYLCSLLNIQFSSNEEVSYNKIFSKKTNTIETQKSYSEADLIRASWSYRIGRFITYIPRKIRGGIQCYKVHGLKYTLSRIIVKIFNHND